MKELTIKVYSFDELPKEAQDKIIERERWNVMDNAMEFSRMEFDDTLKEFERITDSRVTGYDVGYCGYNFGRVCSDKLAFEEFDLEDLSGKLLFRYISNEIMPYLIRGKYYSTCGEYDKNGKCTYKSRRSKVLMESFDGCPLTGVFYDIDVLEPLFDYYHNWARPEYRSLTFRDVMEKCYDGLFNTLYKEYEYQASDESVREELSARENYYYEDGTKCEGYIYSAA
jgi:hypothetical protein